MILAKSLQRNVASGSNAASMHVQRAVVGSSVFEKQNRQQQHKSGGYNLLNSLVLTGIVGLGVFGVGATCKTNTSGSTNELVGSSRNDVVDFCEFKPPLGCGSFGVVRSAKWRETNERVAVKVMSETEKTKPLIDKEIYILEKIKEKGGHVNIVDYKAAFKNNHKNVEQVVLGKNSNKAVTRLTTTTNNQKMNYNDEQINYMETLLDTLFLHSFKSHKKKKNNVDDEKNDSEEYWLLFELISGEELFEKISRTGPMSEDSAKKVLHQVVDALKFLHKQVGIVHGDIKLENLMIQPATTTRNSNSKIKLCDFGSAFSIDNKEQLEVNCSSQDAIGTIAYCAPEVLQDSNKKNNKQQHLTPSIDIWSLGCVLYVLLVCAHPFDPYGEKDDKSLIDSICKSEPDFGDKVILSQEAKNLILKMLEKDPKKRIKLDEILEHPFMLK